MGKILRENKDSGLSGIIKTTVNGKRVRMNLSLESRPSLELPINSSTVDSKPNRENNHETQSQDDLLNIVPEIDHKDPVSAHIVSEGKEEVDMVAKERDFCLYTPQTNGSLARGLTGSTFQEIEVNDPETPDAPRAPKMRPMTNLVPIRVAPLSFETDDEDDVLRCTN